MCTSFGRNETGVYTREESFVYFAQLSDSPKDKSHFVLLKTYVNLLLNLLQNLLQPCALLSMVRAILINTLITYILVVSLCTASFNIKKILRSTYRVCFCVTCCYQNKQP